jgi:acetylornithine deacetylase
MGSPSIHASIIRGGNELSTYPKECKLGIERRTIPGEDVQFVEQEIKSILNKIRKKDSQFRAKSKIIFYRDPMEGSKEEKICKILGKSLYKITKIKPQFIGSSEWLDSGIMSKAGIPSVIFGPGGGGQHGSVEFVYLDQVIATAKVLALTITNFCK